MRSSMFLPDMMTETIYGRYCPRHHSCWEATIGVESYGNADCMCKLSVRIASLNNYGTNPTPSKIKFTVALRFLLL